MSKKKNSSRNIETEFITARCELDDGSTRTFEICSWNGIKIIKDFNGLSFYTHRCVPSIKSVDDVVREIDIVFHCKVTAIKYPHLPDFQPYN